MAEQFEDAIFLDIMGDETNDTRVSAGGSQGFCTERLFMLHAAFAVCSETGVSYSLWRVTVMCALRSAVCRD